MPGAIPFLRNLLPTITYYDMKSQQEPQLYWKRKILLELHGVNLHSRCSRQRGYLVLAKEEVTR